MQAPGDLVAGSRDLPDRGVAIGVEHQPGDLVLVLVGEELVEADGDREGQPTTARRHETLALLDLADEVEVAAGEPAVLVADQIGGEEAEGTLDLDVAHGELGDRRIECGG